MPLRVVHWGTGNTGRHGLRSIIEHPDLELVGVHVHSADKVGRDAGELCGIAPVGVIASNDLQAALALGADCLSYMADGVGREIDATRDVVPFLERGTDVVTCSLIPLLHPASAPPELLGPIADACARGNASLFGSGIDPGYATTQLAASVLSAASDIDSVRVQELGNFSRYGAGHVMREIFGFGQPPAFVPPLFTSGMIEHFWRGTVHEIADLLEITLDDVQLRHEVEVVAHDVETAFGTVAAGTIGAVRFELCGMANGRARSIVEHVDRIDLEVAPQWDRGTVSGGTAYRVVVTGRPSFTTEIGFDLTDGISGAVVATTTFLVNSIPTVCAAAPGVLGRGDVAPFVGRARRS
jgi:hypothetical protein